MKKYALTECRALCICIFLSTAVLFSITHYGGLRSPDSEIVFRAGLSFVQSGRLDVREEMDWKGFGLARARDGRLYPVFGPMLSIVSAPAILAGLKINETDWFIPYMARIPPSYNLTGGLDYAFFGRGFSQLDHRAHALRFLVSFFNIFIGALCAVVFFKMAHLLFASRAASVISTGFLVAGSLLWPYSNTFFSEPLAVLFLLVGLYMQLAALYSKDSVRARWPVLMFFGGLMLGFSAATHISAILYAPFFILINVFRDGESAARPRELNVVMTLSYTAGLSLALFLLGNYNDMRFGDFLETGRTAMTNAQYAGWTAPWRGLYGLLFGSAKGLFIYCPSVALGLACWPHFFRRYRRLSVILLSAVVFRYVFIACRADWHGGFSLGPRYLVLALPILLLPLAASVKNLLANRKFASLYLYAALLSIFAAQQMYFCIGEIFSYLHYVKFTANSKNISALQNDMIYMDWSVSPLTHLLDFLRGPFLLKTIPMNNYALWLVASAIIAAIIFFAFMSLHLRLRAQEKENSPESCAL